MHKLIEEMPYSSTKDLFRSLMTTAGTHQGVSKRENELAKMVFSGPIPIHHWQRRGVVRSKSHHAPTGWVSVSMVSVLCGIL